MIKRRPRKVKRRTDWTIGYEAKVNGRKLSPGVEVALAGVRGRYRFIRVVTNETGSTWADFWGGPPGYHPTRRSVRLDEVKRVYRFRKTDAAEAAKRRDAKREARGQ